MTARHILAHRGGIPETPAEVTGPPQPPPWDVRRWADRDIDVAMDHLVNGFRMDERGTQYRRVIADTVRAACR